MFTSSTVEQLYNQRLSRYVTAMNGGTPDRVPIRFFLQEAAARYSGYTNQQVSCDYNLAFEATRKMALYIGSDAVMLNAIWSNYGVGKSLGLKYYHVPGVDIDINNVQQYSEPSDDDDLFVRHDEYEDLIRDPTEFILTKWMSRASSRISPPGAPVTYDHNVALVSGAMAYANYMNAFGPAANKLKFESGLVSANSGMIKAPFDILADKFRGYMPLIYDCGERPELVLRACEALVPHIIANALGGADPDKNVPITLWAHRGCVPFVNMEIFNNIYFPTLKLVIDEIASRGHQVLFYGEGNWEPHYDALLSFPANTLIYHLDRGEPRKAARLKEKFAVSGGLDYNVLARGNTDEVRTSMAQLFDALAQDGGYILDASALMLSDVKPENVKAAAEYTLEHGVYSQSSRIEPRKRASFDVPPIENTTHRPPNVCRSWEDESLSYKNLSHDTDLVKASWQSVDTAAYNFAWTTVLW